jgi:hypothetical protein
MEENMYINRINIFFLIFLILILFNSCQHFEETIKFDIDLEFDENKKSSILFETEPGCSKTNFKFKKEYYEIEHERYDQYIASNFSEYENTIEKYFEMDFLKRMTPEYFDDNNLIVLVLNFDDGDILKNIRFEKSKENSYIFVVELWDNGTPIFLRKKCIYYKVYILQIEKNK